MNFIDEQIELLKRKHADPSYVAPNLQEVIPQDNDNNEQGLGTWLGAAGIGAGNMLNNTIFGGLGQLLGGIGAGVEFISPFSGSNADKRVELMRLGIPHEVTQSIYPDEDSWIASLGKGSLEIQNAIGDKLGQWRNDVVGDNPSYGTQVGEGVGSSIGFMGAGQAASALAGLAGAGPIGMAIAGLLAMGATEALSESGGVLGDAYRQGKYDEGLSAANKSFATNLALNTTLDSLGGFFSPLATGIRNPITKFGVRTLGQIGNELLQEPSQQTIEKAAQDSIYNGGNFMNALGKRAGEWGQDFMNLAPSVAGSSLITSLLTGAGGLAIPSVRQQVASQYQHRNESSEQAEERIKAHLDAIQALQNRIEKEKTTGNNQDIIDSLNRRIQQRQNQIQRLANTFSITKVDYTPKNLQEQNSTEQQTQQPVQGQQLQAPQIKNAPPHITTGSNEAYYDNDYYSDNGGDNSNLEQDIPETHTPDTVPQNINALGKKPEPEKTVITEALNNATTSQPENHNTGTGGKNQPQRNSTSDEFSQLETPRNPAIDNSPMGNNSIVEAGGKDYAVRYRVEDGMVIGDKAKLSQVSENYAGQSTNTQGANVRKTEAGGVSANAVRIPIPKGQRPGTERIDPRIQPTEAISGLQGLQGLSDDDRMNAAKALMPPNFVQRITPDTNIHVETVRGLPETQRATVEDLTALTDEEKQQLHETLTGRKLRPEAHKINPDENMRVDTERITTNVQKPDAVRGFTDIQRAGIQDLTALPDETKEQVYETLTGRKIQPDVQRISPAGNMHVDARRVPIPKGQIIPTTRLDFSRQRNTQNQQDNITEDSPPFDGYIASFQIGAGDASANVHAFFDTQDGQPFIGIADENGHFIATYDIKNNHFYINEGNQNHSIVKRWGMDRIEKDFKFAFTDNAEGEFNLDYSKNPTEEILRKIFMGKAINAGETQERADSLSRIYVEMNKNLASQTGIPLLDMVMADNMSIQKLNRMDKNSDRGNTKIIPQTDINGNPVLEAQHIVSLFKNSDESSLLHELWHFYQEKIKRLGNAGLIKSGTNLFDDWQAIRSEAGMLQTDFRQPLSVEDNTKWRNSHEKNAASFEKYFRKGLAPEGISKKMQKVFDNFREWLKNVYFKVRDIFYTDAQGYKHNNFAVNPRIRKVFDHIFTGNKKLNNNNNTNTQQNPSFKTDYTGIQDFRQSENNGGFFGWLKRIGKHILHPLYSIAHVEHKPSAIDRIAPFTNPETERRFTEAGKPIPRQGVLGRISHAFKDAAKSIIAGDFSDITNSPRINDKTLSLRGALQSLRTLDRNKKYALEQGREQILNVLKSLKTPQQYELFNRLRVLQDLDWQIQNMPESQLPFDLTHDDVKKALKQYTDLAHQRGNEAVLKAIHDEEQNMRKINEDYIKLSGELGMNMDGVFSNPHYYRHRIIQYAQAIRAGEKHVYSQANQDIQDTVNSLMREAMSRGWLKKRKGSTMDFITDYMEANSEVRIQQLQDIETMKTLLEIKKNFDIAPRIRKQFKLGNVKEDTKPNGAETFSQSGNGEQESILDHIPEGHEAFDINGWNGIEGNKSVQDNLLNRALSRISEEEGLPFDRVIEALSIVDAGNNIMVIPTEIANTLRKMAKARQRGAIAQTARDLTTWWKRSVLFTPTRNLLYNIRNFTGDLDAVIAGNPHALKYLPQSVKELVAYYTKHGKEGYQASQDLQDYIRLSGSLGIQSLNLSKDDARALVDLLTVSNPDKMSKLGKKRGAALEQRINDYTSQDTDIGALKKAWRHKWNLIAKLFDLEHKGTELREHLLRFATYLDYKQQMEGNKNGKPNNWGASLEDEVMAVKDIKERAFKMSNELLGAYDQVSEIGKQLRDMMIPFYSWMEVNMRRSWRLLRNGFKYGKGREAVQKYLTGKLYTLPLYAVPAAYSLSKLLLFTGALQMFNRFWAPDADDDLPNDVKYRPHVTLGKRNGQVYYFDRIGAIADALDWFSLDSAVLDAKDFANGQKTLGSWFKQMVQAPFSKAINGLNPAIKMPIELAMGRSMFPDAFNPSTIRDPAEYIARSFGMAWPYKAITGKPHDNLQELSHLVVYSQDVDEAAYWQTLDRVRQFQTQVLDKHFDGFASTARGRILQNLKKALRYRDNAAIRRYLREYAQADGTKQGLKASMKAMNPLHGLNEKEKAQFMKWLSADDRKYLRKAERYYHQLADRFIR